MNRSKDNLILQFRQLNTYSYSNQDINKMYIKSMYAYHLKWPKVNCVHYFEITLCNESCRRMSFISVIDTQVCIPGYEPIIALFALTIVSLLEKCGGCFLG